MKKLFSILFLILLQSSVFGQSQSLTKTGPLIYTTVIRDIAIDNNGRIYVGFTGGGIWYSDDNGVNWNSLDGFNRLSDNPQDFSLSVSRIFIDPDNGNIYVGTGDLLRSYSDNFTINFNNFDQFATYQRGAASYPGKGVFVSTDGGQTFSNNNATKTTSYSGLGISISDIEKSGNRLFIGTAQGLYFSDDNLATLSQTSNVNPGLSQGSALLSYLKTKPVDDIAVLDSNKILVTNPFRIYILTNNGDNLENSFADLSGTAIVGGEKRVEFAVSKDKKVVYLMSVKADGTLNGVWKSSDNANTWTKIAGSSNLLFDPLTDGKRYSTIFVDPTDNDVVYIGGNTLYKYDPVTGTWKDDWTGFFMYPGNPKFTGSKITAAEFSPTAPNTLFMASLGFLVKSTDKASTFSIVKTLLNSNAEFVSRGVSAKTFVGNAYLGTLVRPTLENYSYFMESAFSPTPGQLIPSAYNGDFVIRGGPYGSIMRSLLGGEAFEDFWGYPADTAKYSVINLDTTLSATDTLISGKDGLPGDYSIVEDQLGFNRIQINHNTPFVVDEERQDSLVIIDTLGNYLYPSYLYTMLPPSKKQINGNDFGWIIWQATNPFARGPADSVSKWTRISPLIYLESLNQSVREAPTAMTQLGDADKTIWVGTSKGQIFRVAKPYDFKNCEFSVVEGNTVTHSNPLAGTTETFPGANNLPDKSISDFAVHPTNPNIVVVSFMGYDTTGGYLYITYNALSANPTFTRIYSVPNVPIYSIEFNPVKHPANPDNVLLVGTEQGLRFITDITQGSSYPSFLYKDDALYNVPIKDISFFEWVVVKEFVKKVGEEEFYQYRLIKEPWPILMIATDGLGVLETYAGNATNIKVLDNSEEKASMKIFPNPAVKEDFKVQISLNGDVKNPRQNGTIKIYDLQGSVVYYNVFNMYKTYEEKIPVQNFTSGAYIVEVYIPEIGYKNSQKVIINK